jgi:PEP-CTERM motif
MRSFLFTFPQCRFVLTVVTGTVLAAVPASASRLWNWQYTASEIAASGTFTTVDSPEADGGYLITDITGTRNGFRITGLQPPGTPIPGNDHFLVDDLVFLGPGPQLTSHGFGFSISNGDFSNPFYADFLPTPVYLEFLSIPPFANGDHTELPIQFSATPVPEPATFFLLMFGALALGAFRSRVQIATPSGGRGSRGLLCSRAPDLQALDLQPPDPGRCGRRPPRTVRLGVH